MNIRLRTVWLVCLAFVAVSEGQIPVSAADQPKATDNAALVAEKGPSPIPTPPAAIPPIQPSAVPTTHPNQPLLTEHPSNSKPSSDSEDSHGPFVTSWFLEGTAAIFGVLSVFIAVCVIIMAFIGVSNYKELQQKAQSDLTIFIKAELSQRLNLITKNEFDSAIREAMDDHIAKAVEAARTRLMAEFDSLVAQRDWRDQLVAEISTKVEERLRPQATPTNPGEFV